MRTFTTAAGLGTILALCIASMPASSQTTNWTGFYFGGNFGLDAGHNGTQEQTTLTPAGVPNVTSPGVINPIATSSYTQTPIGILGGGQAGYNWQSAQWVLGAEADFDWTNQRSTSSSDSFLSAGPSVNVFDPFPATRQNFINDQTIRWLSTFRARAGRAEGSGLWFLTGGLAVAQVDSSYSFAVNGSSPGTALNTNGVTTLNNSTTKTGWTIGGGVETSLASFDLPNWSAKLEYLYVDLGSINNTLIAPAPNIPGSYLVNSSSSLHDHIVRLGINYRFGAPGAIEAEAPPANTPRDRDWTGFYVGVNAGGSLGLNPAQDLTQFAPNGLTPSGFTAGFNNPITNSYFNHSPFGPIGGGQLGYSMQFGNWLLGVEGDWDFANQSSVATKSVFFGSTVSPAPTILSYRDEQHLRWIATTRARVGRVEHDWLWYATAGLAFAQIDSMYTFAASTNSSAVFTANGISTIAAGGIQAGWTVGGGMETSLASLGMPRWSTKFEYLYVNLGKTSNAFSVAAASPGFSYLFTSSSSINLHMARLGLNYHF